MFIRYDMPGCVRTIVVWKHAIREDAEQLKKELRKNHSGMETKHGERRDSGPDHVA